MANEENQKRAKETLIKLLESSQDKTAASNLINKIQSDNINDLTEAEIQQIAQLIGSKPAEQGNFNGIQLDARVIFQSLGISDALPSSGALPDRVEAETQKVALQEFDKELQAGVNAKEAVNTATKIAYQEAIQMGADESKAKVAAVKAREAILEKLSEKGDFETVDEARADQIDFGKMSGSVKVSDQLMGGLAGIENQAAGNSSSSSNEGGTDSAQSLGQSSSSLRGSTSEEQVAGGATVELGQHTTFDNLSTRVETKTLGLRGKVFNQEVTGSYVSQQVGADGTVTAELSEFGMTQEVIDGGGKAKAGLDSESKGPGQLVVDQTEIVVEEITEEAAQEVFIEIPPTEISLKIKEIVRDPNGGKSIFSFEITKGMIGNPSSVFWELEGNVPDDIKLRWPSGVLNFGASEKTKVITVEIPGTDLPADELFTVLLKPQDSLTFLRDQGEKTIRGFEDNAVVKIEALQTELVEARENEESFLEFRISRDRAGGESTVEWEVEDGGNGQGKLDGSDFIGGALPFGVVKFEPGETEKIIRIPVRGDKDIEPDEVIKVRLKNPSDLITISEDSEAAATTIIADDVHFELSGPERNNQLETDSGSTNDFIFTITRSGDLRAPLDVEWSVTGSGDNPVSDQEFVALTGTVRFEAGETNKPVLVQVSGDLIGDPGEKFQLSITPPDEPNIYSGTTSLEASLVDNEAILEISLDNSATQSVSNNLFILTNVDGKWSFSASPSVQSGLDSTNLQRVLEGGDGTTSTHTFTVTRSGYLDNFASAQYRVSGINGLNGEDFLGGVLPSGIVEFLPGETIKTVTIEVQGDEQIEDDEIFTVELFNGSPNVDIQAGTASTVIVADDIHFELSGPEVDNQLEVDSNLTNDFKFTVTRSGDLRFPKTVDWTVTGTGDKPVSVEEFLAVSGSVTFETGETTKTITIQVRGDLIGDSGEKFTLNIQPPDEPDVYSGTTSIQAAIVDNEAVLTIVSDQAGVIEGGDGKTSVHTFTVTRSGYLDDFSSVEYRAFGQNGLNAEDFKDGIIPSGILDFAPGETTKTITVEVDGSREVESDEAFSIELFNGSSNVDIQSSAASTVIIDDDSLVQVIATSNTVSESGSGGFSTLTWEIQRSNTVTGTTVDWTLDGEFDLDDFGGLRPFGTVSFAPGESTKVVEIQIPGDEFIEKNSTYSLRLTGTGDGANIDPNSQTAPVLLKDDDLGFNILGLVTEELEGNVGEESIFTYKVVRSIDLDAASEIKYRLVQFGSFSTNSDDFVDGQDMLNVGLPSGIITFAPGESEKIIQIRAKGDNEAGGDEKFGIVLSDPPAGTRILVGTSSGTLKDNDAKVSLISYDSEQLEGNLSNPNYTLTFERKGFLQQEASFQYRILGYGENRANAQDFLMEDLPSGEVVFEAGESTTSISLQIKGDKTLEGREHFQIELFNPDGLEVFGSGTVFTINPDESAISIKAVKNLLIEGSETNKAHQFEVIRSGFTEVELTVDWLVVAGTVDGADENDFGGILPSGSLSFAAGETSKLIVFEPTADTDLEISENYTVRISSDSDAAVLLKDSENGVIANDDDGFSVIATDLEREEADTEPITFTFQVDRSGYLFQQSSVDWRLIPSESNGVDADDFVGESLPSGTLEFGQGEKIKTVTFQVKPDQVLEADEGFSILLENPSTGSTLVIHEVDGTVLNDDAVFKLDSDELVLNEGQTGVTEFRFDLTREGNLNSPDTVEYTVAGKGDNPSDANDFAGNQFPSGIVSFAAGESSKEITVSVLGDTQPEEDESFEVVLSNPSTGTAIADGSVSATILTDDDELSLTSTVDTQVEADTQTVTYIYTVNRTLDLDTTTTVNWNVTGHGDHPVNQNDFLGGLLPGGSLTFALGEAAKTIEFQALGDNSTEENETFIVTLSNPSPGTSISTATAQGTLNNDDSGLSIVADSSDKNEGTDAGSIHTFTVTRTGTLMPATTVTWNISGTGTHPTDADDFLQTTGTIRFEEGDSTQTIQLDVIGDTEIESDESYILSLSDPTSGDEILNASASGLVRTDDAGLSVQANSAAVPEGVHGATTTITFTVNRTGDLSSTSTADWNISGSVEASDFFGNLIPSGTVSFAPNVTSQNVTITVAGDRLVEADEPVTLTLSNPNTGTYISTATATTTITNDDSELDFSDFPASVNEGTVSPTTLTYTVTRSGDLSAPASVDWILSSSGTNPARIDDFVPGNDELGTNSGLPSGTISFAADEAVQEISIEVLGDSTVEESETFQISFVNAGSNLDASVTPAETTLTNDDTGISISAVDQAIFEDDLGTKFISFEIVRGGEIGDVVEVDYAVGGDVSAEDFGGSLPSGTVVFQANETKKTVSLELHSDTVVESDESLAVTISNAHIQGTSDQLPIETNSATTVIKNDDESFSASVSDPSLTESDSGLQNLAFAVTRSGDLSKTLTVDYQLVGTNGADSSDIQELSLPAGTLTFQAGEASKSIDVNVTGDLLVENDEVFKLVISNPSDGTLGVDEVSATIFNDDTSFAISADAASINEGQAGATLVTFTVARNGLSSGTANVDFAVTASDLNLNGSDFLGGTLPSGTITFADGETTKTLTLQVAGDASLESDEEFTVTLSNPDTGILESGSESATMTIVSDDDVLTLTSNQLSADEDHSGKIGRAHV